MPLTINLLHEEQFLLKQRQRDPLKLGIYALAGVAALFLLYYLVRVAQSSALNNELHGKQAEWAKQEPAAKAADAQEADYTAQVSAAGVVTKRIEGRFYWAPLLGTLIRAVPTNVQIVNFTGTNEPKTDKITLTLEGTVAGEVPRLAADKFRESLTASLNKDYQAVETSFRGLEESPGTVPLNGKPTPTAHFTIEVKLNKPAAVAAAAATPPPAAARHRQVAPAAN